MFGLGKKVISLAKFYDDYLFSMDNEDNATANFPDDQSKWTEDQWKIHDILSSKKLDAQFCHNKKQCIGKVINKHISEHQSYLDVRLDPAPKHPDSPKVVRLILWHDGSNKSLWWQRQIWGPRIGDAISISVSSTSTIKLVELYPD